MNLLSIFSTDQLAGYRIKLLIAGLVITPLGFYSKFYSGPLEDWVNYSLGGVLYVIFWCLVVAFVFPKIRAWKIAIGVLLVTCTLEVLQLSDAYLLEQARSFFIGRVVLGTSFVWSDFFYYFIGSVAGWLLLNKLGNKQLCDNS